MSAGKDLGKTWIPLASRPRTETFNASGNVTIPYGRYRGTVEGRAGTGVDGTITGYNTNYNVVYPIANQPIAGYNTNYNVAYPIGSQPIANQPVANYNVSYPVAGYNVAYPYAGLNPPGGGFLSGIGVYTLTYTGCALGGRTDYIGQLRGDCPTYQSLPYGTGTALCQSYGQGNNTNGQNKSYTCYYYYNPVNPGNPAYNVVYGTNYNVSYPAGNYNTNYNTNYNVAYPVAFTPVAGYNTNYNIAYPIANQPIAGYNPGNPGQATTVLGVYFPGGGVTGGIGQLAPTISATTVNYFSFPDGAPSATYPVTVPTGGQIIVKIE